MNPFTKASKQFFIAILSHWTERSRNE